MPSDRSIYLDFDGTLVDSIPILKKSLEQICIRLGLSYTELRFEEYNGLSIESIIDNLLNENGNKFPKAQIRSEYLELIHSGYHNVLPKLGALELLEAAKSAGISCWIVSSGKKQWIQSFVENKFPDLIKGIVAAEDVNAHKPDPAPYKKAMDMEGTGSESLFAVEDGAKGAQSAHAAGLKVLYLGTDPLDFEVVRVSDLKGVLNELKWPGINDVHFLELPNPMPGNRVEVKNWSDEAVKVADDIWNISIKENQKLFDGPTLIIDERSYQIYQTSYKFTLALQHLKFRNAAKEANSLRGLAVTGILSTKNGYAFGRRGAVHRGSGLWELIPSGGVDVNCIKNGRIDLEEQFLTELEEESGIISDKIKNIKLSGLIIEGRHTLDFVFEAEAMDVPKNQAGGEYSEFRCVGKETWAKFKSSENILPASVKLFEMKVLGFES